MQPFARDAAAVALLLARCRELSLAALTLEGLTWALSKATELRLALSHIRGSLGLVPREYGAPTKGGQSAPSQFPRPCSRASGC